MSVNQLSSSNINRAFDILRDLYDPNKSKDSPKSHLHGFTRWQIICITGVGIPMLVDFGLILAFRPPSKGIMTSFWILAIVSFVFFVFYLISMFREARKNQRESMKHTVEELKSRTVRDLKTVEQLRAVDDLLALKFVELQFRREIDRIDARGKFFISFLKNAGPAVFALGFLLGVVDFTSATPNINTLPAIYLTTFGAVIVVMLAFIEPAFQVPIDRLKKGLTLLEQAQITE